MADFQQQLTEWYVKTMQKASLTVRETIIGVATSVVDKSPVGDPSLWVNPHPPKGYEGGHFKANWRGGVGAINEEVTDDIDPTGETSLIQIISAIPEKPEEKVFYITNSLPYAQSLEDGHSTQAPQGMVGLTALEFESIVDNAVLKVIK